MIMMDSKTWVMNREKKGNREEGTWEQEDIL